MYEAIDWAKTLHAEETNQENKTGQAGYI